MRSKAFKHGTTHESFADVEVQNNVIRNEEKKRHFTNSSTSCSSSMDVESSKNGTGKANETPVKAKAKGLQMRKRFDIKTCNDGSVFLCSGGNNGQLWVLDLGMGIIDKRETKSGGEEKGGEGVPATSGPERMKVLAEVLLPSRLRGRVTSVAVSGEFDQILFATDDGILWRMDRPTVTVERTEKKATSAVA